MSKEKLSVIIILGPPGSGKGTQAGLIAEKINAYHFETSEIIESKLADFKKTDFVKVGSKKFFLLKEQKLRNSGKWMSPPLISFWTKSKIKELSKRKKGIIFSGSPKTVHEAKEIIPLLKKLYGVKNITSLTIKQKPGTSIIRNSQRRICELMRHSILYTKETAKLKTCPFDGSKLIFREDNRPEVVKSKLKEYNGRTLPIIDYFKQEKIKVKEINGEQKVANVFADILKALEQK